MTTLRDVTNQRSEAVDRAEHEPHRVAISADDLASLEETREIVSRRTLVTEIRASLAEMGDNQAPVLSKGDILASVRL